MFEVKVAILVADEQNWKASFQLDITPWHGPFFISFSVPVAKQWWTVSSADHAKLMKGFMQTPLGIDGFIVYTDKEV